jgi:hypothetical protein
MREITTGPEPKTYERKRSILEGILDLRMNYYDGDLEIEGKVPAPAADTSTGSGKKKCNTGLTPYFQGSGQPRICGDRSESGRRLGNLPRLRKFKGFRLGGG